MGPNSAAAAAGIAVRYHYFIRLNFIFAFVVINQWLWQARLDSQSEVLYLAAMH